MDRGTYIEHDGRPAVRFQRIYPHPIERVWAAVTEPDGPAHWFPSTVKIELRSDELVAKLPDLDSSHPLPESPWFEPGVRWSARRVLLHALLPLDAVAFDLAWSVS